MDKIFAKGGTYDFIYTALNKSIDTVIMFGEWIVFLFTTVILAYYLITSEVNKSENILIKELRHISKKVGRVCLAYVKTQLVIMSITSVICIACFMIIRNKYALLLGILVGFLDALPLIGIGIIEVILGPVAYILISTLMEE